MTKIGEIYKCEICGNVVSVAQEGVGTLVCCNQNMKLLEKQNIDKEGKEKHVPVLSMEGNKVTVKVGSIEHPMEEEHHIVLIQILKDNKVIKEKRLYPGEKPEAIFLLENTEGIKAREFCNLHGLWIN